MLVLALLYLCSPSPLALLVVELLLQLTLASFFYYFYWASSRWTSVSCLLILIPEITWRLTWRTPVSSSGRGEGRTPRASTWPRWGRRWWGRWPTRGRWGRAAGCVIFVTERNNIRVTPSGGGLYCKKTQAGLHTDPAGGEGEQLRGILVVWQGYWWCFKCFAQVFMYFVHVFVVQI